MVCFDSAAKDILKYADLDAICDIFITDGFIFFMLVGLPSDGPQPSERHRWHQSCDDRSWVRTLHTSG